VSADETFGQELAHRLKELRLAAGLSGRELSRRSLVSQAKISRIESGKVKPSPTDVVAIAREVCPDEDAAAAVAQLAEVAAAVHESSRLSSKAGWKHTQRNLMNLEQSSEKIRFFLPAMLTGLLQTRDYAYASCVDPFDPTTSPGRATADLKISRQQILLNQSIRFEFVIMPAALRLRFLDPDRMSEQAEHLIELSRRPNLSLRVVSEDLNHAGPMNTFTVYDHRVVTAELFSGAVTLTHHADVAYHHQALDYFLSVSLGEEETREWISSLQLR